MNSIVERDGIQDLADRYPVWLCDIWGVLHNGVEAFSSAVDALSRFRAGGGVAALLSNSPRPAGSVAEQLEQIGVPEGVFDTIVTSGDVTRELIADNLGEIFFHLGPERDAPIFAGFDIDLGELDEATVVLCTGLFDDEKETPEDYSQLLGQAAQRSLPMICANPDRVVQRGDRMIFCAGALAEAYQAIGGQVSMAGKPHPPIYLLARERLDEFCGSDPASRDILVIGDGVATDMAGAAQQGFDALFISGGIHAGELPAGQVAETLKESVPNLNLIGIQNILRW